MLTGERGGLVESLVRLGDEGGEAAPGQSPGLCRWPARDRPLLMKMTSVRTVLRASSACGMEMRNIGGVRKVTLTWC